MRPHMMVDAKAGSGKSTTLIHGMEYVTTGKVKCKFAPSKYQKDIWSALVDKEDPPRDIVFCAFGKSIADHLADRVPEGCTAATLHSTGLRLIKKHHTINKFSVTKNYGKTKKIIEQIMEKDIKELWKTHGPMIKAATRLTSLCKLVLSGSTEEDGSNFVPFLPPSMWEQELDQLVQKYDVDLAGFREETYKIVPEILDRSWRLPVRGQGAASIDFDDMIWLPIVLKYVDRQYDLLLVDEAQDLNPCQQELAIQLGKRIVFCGDPMQAIFGFAAADTESMDNLRKRLEITERGIETFPLPETYRCGKLIVKEANKIVPDFWAHESNPDGYVGSIEEEEIIDELQSGDMVICRVNAALIGICFKLVSSGKPAYIQGKDVGQMLIDYIDTFKVGNSVEALAKAVTIDCQCKISDIRAMEKPNEGMLIMLQDKMECITTLCMNCDSVEQVIKTIEEMFTDDDQKGVRLSSIHRAKGLEADSVYILRPDLMPHPLAKSKWEKKQESNLEYVGITRAIHRLYRVRHEVENYEGYDG